MVQRKKLNRRRSALQEAVLTRVSERRARFRDKVRAQSCPLCGNAAISRLHYGQASATAEYRVDIDSDLLFDVGRDYVNGDPVWICLDCVHTWGQRDDSSISWTAHFSSGFSQSLLGYRIQCEDAVADLSAHWLWPKPSFREFRVRFAIDDQPVAVVVPALRTMNERYLSHFDDLGISQLIVETRGETLRRTFEHGACLDHEVPQVRPFLDLFAWLHDEVLDQLPFEVRNI